MRLLAGLLLLLSSFAASAQDAEATALLKQLRDKYVAAKTLHVNSTFSGTANGKIMHCEMWFGERGRFRIEVAAIGAFDMSTAVCDGKKLRISVPGEAVKVVDAPKGLAQILRADAATAGFLVTREIEGITAQTLNVTDSKSGPDEKVGAAALKVVTYTLKPASKPIKVRCSIDLETLAAVRREIEGGELKIQDGPIETGFDEDLKDALFRLPHAKPSSAFITNECIQALLAEVRPLVEKETGVTFDMEPTVCLSDVDSVAGVLERELAPQMKLLVPNQEGEELEESTHKMARAYASHLLGKYEPAANTLHILAPNFATLAQLADRPEIATPDTLRLVMIHELVHAADQQAYKIFDRIPALKTQQDLSIWNALIEGHAQNVTKTILCREQREEVFRGYEECITLAPAGSVGEKFLAGVLSAQVQFSYVSGQRFFEAMAKDKRKIPVADLFANPPRSTTVLLHPERYDPSAKAPKALDLASTWKALAEPLGEDWECHVKPLGEVELRAGCGDMVEKQDIDAALATFTSGQAAILQPTDEPGSKMIVFCALEFETVAAAQAMYELNLKIAKIKDERMKTGNLAITSAAYRPIKAKDAAGATYTAKTIRYQGQNIEVAGGLAYGGRCYVEILFSNETCDEKRMISIIEVIVAGFNAKK